MFRGCRTTWRYVKGRWKDCDNDLPESSETPLRISHESTFFRGWRFQSYVTNIIHAHPLSICERSYVVYFWCVLLDTFTAESQVNPLTTPSLTRAETEQYEAFSMLRLTKSRTTDLQHHKTTTRRSRQNSRSRTERWLAE